MDNEIIKADPAFRKKVLIIALLLVLAGAAAISVLMPWIQNRLAEEDTMVAIRMLRFLIIALFTPPLIFAFWMISFALKAYKQGLFPPEGTKVIKDTPRLQGKPAKSKAIALMALVIILVLCCAMAVSFASRFFALLLAT